MRAGFDKRWLLPLGVLTASALIALNIVVFGPSFGGGSSGEVAVSETATDCSGALSSDYACHQQRYQTLVRGSGVEAALAELKDEYKKSDFVKSNCHQLTHVIGRAAAERHGELSASYGRGDDLCGGGYYHGATEAVVAKTGAEKMLEEAGTLCADLRENQKYSLYHRDCVHGLGHGFMGVLENELFEALQACDALTDGWEQEHCYGGVFMQNVMAEDDPSHPSKYLDIDRPLYPCTDVEARYKDRCYQHQTSYALETQGGDFAGVFELCKEVEDGSRPACYGGLGGYAVEKAIRDSVTDVGRAESVNMLCALGEDYGARSNCVFGAIANFIRYRGDAQARAFCESLDDADLRAVCFRAGEEYYEVFDPD